MIIKTKHLSFISRVSIVMIVTLFSSSYILHAQELDLQQQSDDLEGINDEENDQENLKISDSSESLSISQQILRKERLAEEIEDQHKQLLGQLNQYQLDERQYRVALDQFRRLQTLSSIEEVVIVSKKLILSRNVALNSYINLLRLKIIESEGIELSHKNRVIERLEVIQRQLSDHSSQAEAITQKDDVNNLATSFKPLSESISATSYYTLSVLAVGKLQSVYDQAVVINQKILENSAKSESFNDAARTRSLSEVNKLLSELPPLFNSVWVEISTAETKTMGYESVYKGLNRSLNSIYSRLSRLVAYFEELESVN